MYARIDLDTYVKHIVDKREVIETNVAQLYSYSAWLDFTEINNNCILSYAPVDLPKEFTRILKQSSIE